MGCGNSANKKFMKAVNVASNTEKIVMHDLSMEMKEFIEFLNNVSENKKAVSFSLKQLTIDGCRLTSLNCASTLKEVELVALNNFGAKKGISLMKLMQDNPNIEKLVLKEIDLEEQDADYVAEFLKRNSKNLKFLDLSGNYFGSKTSAIFKALGRNVSLSEVILMNMNIDGELIGNLSQALENNKDIEKLNISNNPIRTGTSSMKSLFYFNGKMKELAMNNCDIDDDAFSYILEYLEQDKCLTHLYLNNNELTENSVESIQKMFETNQSLEYLYMLKNKIYKRDLSSGLGNREFEKCIAEL